MRAGSLRERVDLQSLTNSIDGWGDDIGTWSIYAASVPASIYPISGVEAFQNRDTEARVTHKITIRYSSTVAVVVPKHRIKYGSRYFDIKSAMNIGERDRMIEMLCEEVV